MTGSRMSEVSLVLFCLLLTESLKLNEPINQSTTKFITCCIVIVCVNTRMGRMLWLLKKYVFTPTNSLL